MDGSDQWHTCNVQNSTCDTSAQTDLLPQRKLFLCGYAVLNRTVWHIINCAHNWNSLNYILHS
jgi:hypothetical protein